MGQIQEPRFLVVSTPEDHMTNAIIEFVALTEASCAVKKKDCRKILQSFHRGDEGLLKVLLDEAEGSIYNNKTSAVLKGQEMTLHMAAFCITGGFIPLDEEKTRRTGIITYATLTTDPIVVTTKDTKIWLNDKILARAKSLLDGRDCADWKVPDIIWNNGVPGSGKSTWIINNFHPETDIIVVTTSEAKMDLRERISSRLGAVAASRVRTMASVLANGVQNLKEHRCSSVAPPKCI